MAAAPCRLQADTATFAIEEGLRDSQQDRITEHEAKQFPRDHRLRTGYEGRAAGRLAVGRAVRCQGVYQIGAV